MWFSPDYIARVAVDKLNDLLQAHPDYFKGLVKGIKHEIPSSPSGSHTGIRVFGSVL
jgi:hypothetical protein